ncbi:DNA polymerase III subunit alpha [Loigolactobacillus zhaoyuanensis]|uniref:DNA polymerase III subunit alpha n=1 Tax=Loigolactobacillus zhaoyuanensis TaxID=2486017 RepID=UPI000F749761|nr:DNA polymerase III subunit alpha [Loigolactobacillus zhaoyuanensis]
MTFVQLQVKSAYSLLESSLTIAELVKNAKARGYQALALTDFQSLSASIDFYTACQAAGLQPILGLTIAPAGLFTSEQPAPLLVYALNQVGYQALLKLSTRVMTSDTQLTLKELQPYLGDLVVVTPAYAAELPELAITDRQQAQHYIQQLQALKPAQLRLGISLQPEGQAYVAMLKQLSETSGVPLIALEDVCYLDPQDAFSVTVLQHIKAGTTLDTAVTQESGTHYLMPAAEVAERYRANGLAAAVTATEQLAAASQLEIKLHNSLLPKFPVPTIQSSHAYLREVAEQGLAQRFNAGQVPPAYQKRLDYELNIIEKMGFEDYFLIIWDVMQYAHRVNILTGPGRGSAAGALVAYALAITEVDPLQYDLLFERFLNPERHNMPDIDLDIPDNKREQLLQYVHEKYGQQHMAQIITFGTLAAKQALRDVGRVLGLTQFEMADWSKAIPAVLHINLETAYKQSLRLRNLVSDSPRNQLLFATAQKIEGLPRHYSTHAAGIVLSDQDLTDYLPLQTGSEGILLTQLPMGNVEALGLLKMDFLGLRNLSILANTLNLIKLQTGKALPIAQVPLDDAATLALFQRGDTDGVFQFESAGIKNVLRELQPTGFEDIVAVNALYRPGPMANIPTFIKRKHEQKEPHYPDQRVATILAPTYGVLVYQEQVMQVAAVMGGFSLGEADSLRRAMSKKKKSVIDAKRDEFLTGALARGYKREVATQMYDYIESFADYGFNRSHAVAYSMVAFQLAYLKAHYPAAFFAALLNSVIGNPTKTKSYLAEAKKRHLTILAPDVNQSQLTYTVQRPNKILFGLMCIKGLRRQFVTALLAERRANGRFVSLEQFLQRLASLDDKWLTMNYLAPLIYSNAFHEFNDNRGALLKRVPQLVANTAFSGQNELLAEELALKEEAVPDLTLADKLDQEEKYLGAYLSGHPVEKYANLQWLKPTVAISELVAGKRQAVLLFVKRIKVIRTKRGEQMAFLTANDPTDELDVTVFPRLYRQISPWLEKGQVIYVAGKADEQRGELQLIAEQIQTAADLEQQLPQEMLFLRLNDEQTEAVQTLLQQNKGNTPVLLFYPTTKRKILLRQPYWIDLASEVVDQLAVVLGDANVVVKAQTLPAP